jgi:hypothetical protein
MDVYCCSDEYCDESEHKDESVCCEDPDCEGDEIVTCCDEVHEGPVQGVKGSEVMDKELQDWACSKEGCHAIQQYVG